MDNYATDEFDEYLAEQLKDPEFTAAWEDGNAREAVMDALVALRKHLGLTQTEAARRMGIRQPTLAKIEAEGSDPHVSTIFRYARALGTRLRMEIEQQDRPV